MQGTSAAKKPAENQPSPSSSERSSDERGLGKPLVAVYQATLAFERQKHLLRQHRISETIDYVHGNLDRLAGVEALKIQRAIYDAQLHSTLTGLAAGGGDSSENSSSISVIPINLSPQKIAALTGGSREDEGMDEMSHSSILKAVGQPPSTIIIQPTTRESPPPISTIPLSELERKSTGPRTENILINSGASSENIPSQDVLETSPEFDSEESATVNQILDALLNQDQPGTDRPSSSNANPGGASGSTSSATAQDTMEIDEASSLAATLNQARKALNLNLGNQDNQPLGDINSYDNGVDEFYIDTRDLCSRIAYDLKKYDISQGLFANRVLNRQQATLSCILRYPKPWNSVKPNGRQTFRRMYNWLRRPLDERLAEMEQWKAEAVKAALSEKDLLKNAHVSPPQQQQQQIKLEPLFFDDEETSALAAAHYNNNHYGNETRQFNSNNNMLMKSETLAPPWTTTVNYGLGGFGEEERNLDDKSLQGYGRPRRQRVVFSSFQRKTLEAIWEETHHPSKEMQQMIAEQLELNLFSVQNFFSNARHRLLANTKGCPDPNQRIRSITPPPSVPPSSKYVASGRPPKKRGFIDDVLAPRKTIRIESDKSSSPEATITTTTNPGESTTIHQDETPTTIPNISESQKLGDTNSITITTSSSNYSSLSSASSQPSSSSTNFPVIPISHIVVKQQALQSDFPIITAGNNQSIQSETISSPPPSPIKSPIKTIALTAITTATTTTISPVVVVGNSNSKSHRQQPQQQSTTQP